MKLGEQVEYLGHLARALFVLDWTQGDSAEAVADDYGLELDLVDQALLRAAELATTLPALTPTEMQVVGLFRQHLVDKTDPDEACVDSLEILHLEGILCLS